MVSLGPFVYLFIPFFCEKCEWVKNPSIKPGNNYSIFDADITLIHNLGSGLQCTSGMEIDLCWSPFCSYLWINVLWFFMKINNLLVPISSLPIVLICRSWKIIQSHIGKEGTDVLVTQLKKALPWSLGCKNIFSFSSIFCGLAPGTPCFFFFLINLFFIEG